MKYKYVSAVAIYLMGTGAVFSQSAFGTGSGSSDTPSAVASNVIYGINADNTGLISFDSSTGETQSVQRFSFYSQGQAPYDVLQDKIFLFDSNNDEIIGYDVGAKSTSSTTILNDANQVQSVFGIMVDGTFIAKTDDFSEADSTAQRFAKISGEGALSRIGTPLVTGSEYPQGNAHYIEISNSIYTISNNSTQKLSILDLNTNAASGFVSAVTSLDGLSADGEIIYGRDTVSNPQQILKVDTTTETTSVLVASPPSGYDSLGTAYVNDRAKELTVILGKAGGSGVATYDLTTGNLKKLTDTSSMSQASRIGRFVNTTLAVNVSSGEVSLSENIESSIGSILKLGDGTLELTGTNSSTGGVDVEAGTLKVAGSDQLGYGNVSLEGGELELSGDATVTNAISSSDDESSIDTGANTVTISGDVYGYSEINKTGSGTLILTGALNNSGGLDVNAGTLVANGAGSTPVTITDGRLEGSGSIGSLISNGTIAPGNSIGTLNVSGTVTLNSDSVLVIEVDASGNSDKIVATGAVTAGGTLRVSPENGTYTDGQQYTIITGSSVSGTFSSVTVLSCTGTATPSYDATSITFTLSGCSASRPGNVGTLISYINDLDTSGSSDLQAVVAALNNLSGDAYNKAIASLDSNSFSAIRTANLQQLSAIYTMINQRVGANLNGNSSPVTNLSRKNSDLTQDLDGLTFAEQQEVVGRKGPWIRMFYTQSSHKDDDDTGVNGSNFSSSGVTLGYDFSAQNAVYGYAVSYLDGQITANNSEGRNNQTTTVVTGYRANSLANGRTLNLAASMVFNDHSSARDIAFTGVSRTASAKYKSSGLDLSGSFMFAPKGMFGGQSTTELSAGIYHSETEAFTETGAGSLNLTVDSFTSSIGRVGVKETIVWNQNTLAEDAYIPFASVGLNASGELGAGNASQALSGQSSVITKTQSKIQSDIEVGVGFYRSLKNNGEFSGGVLAKIGQAYTAQEAHLTYRLRF